MSDNESVYKAKKRYLELFNYLCSQADTIDSRLMFYKEELREKIRNEIILDIVKRNIPIIQELGELYRVLGLHKEEEAQ